MITFTCLSAKLCIGPWSGGAQTGVITSASPTGKNAWAVTRLHVPVPGYHVAVVSCASGAKLCVAGDSRGDLYTGQARA